MRWWPTTSAAEVFFAFAGTDAICQVGAYGDTSTQVRKQWELGRRIANDLETKRQSRPRFRKQTVVPFCASRAENVSAFVNFDRGRYFNIQRKWDDGKAQTLEYEYSTITDRLER